MDRFMDIAGETDRSVLESAQVPIEALPSGGNEFSLLSDRALIQQYEDAKTVFTQRKGETLAAGKKGNRDEISAGMDDLKIWHKTVLGPLRDELIKRSIDQASKRSASKHRDRFFDGHYPIEVYVEKLRSKGIRDL